MSNLGRNLGKAFKEQGSRKHYPMSERPKDHHIRAEESMMG
jgi:hypothetical protein